MWTAVLSFVLACSLCSGLDLRASRANVHPLLRREPKTRKTAASGNGGSSVSGAGPNAVVTSGNGAYARNNEYSSDISRTEAATYASAGDYGNVGGVSGNEAMSGVVGGTPSSSLEEPATILASATSNAQMDRVSPLATSSGRRALRRA